MFWRGANCANDISHHAGRLAEQLARVRSFSRIRRTACSEPTARRPLISTCDTGGDRSSWSATSILMFNGLPLEADDELVDARLTECRIELLLGDDAPRAGVTMEVSKTPLPVEIVVRPRRTACRRRRTRPPDRARPSADDAPRNQLLRSTFFASLRQQEGAPRARPDFVVLL